MKFITADFGDRPGFDGYPKGAPSDLIQVQDDYVIEAPWYETSQEEYSRRQKSFLPEIAAENERLAKLAEENPPVEPEPEKHEEINSIVDVSEAIEAGTATQQEVNATLPDIVKLLSRLEAQIKKLLDTQ